MKKINNQKGSVLQIVLIVFMVLNMVIISMSKIVIENARTFHYIEQLNSNRIIEIQALYHLKQEIIHTTLTTDTIEIENTKIIYEVEQEENLYYISMRIITDIPYALFFVIDSLTLVVESFTYQ